MSKVYDSLKDGDKVVCTLARPYFTVGNFYRINKAREDSRPVVYDRDSDSVILSRTDFNAYMFVLDGTEEYERFKEFQNLEIGSKITAHDTEDWVTQGESYEIIGRRDSGTLVTSEGLVNFNRYMLYFELPKQDEAKHIQPQDYLSIIDCAIDTNDKEWFNELSILSAGNILEQEIQQIFTT